MWLRCLAIACLAACGQVAQQPMPDAGIDAAIATPYAGALSQTTAVMFGGTPYCNYTITLKQIAIDLDILPTGRPSSGHVQALNVEATDATCPNPVFPPTIAHHTLRSSNTGDEGH